MASALIALRLDVLGNIRWFRDHDTVSPKALDMETFDRLSREFKQIGFQFVALDVDGYRTGALNEVLTQIKIPSR